MKMKPVALFAIICAAALVVFGGLGVIALVMGDGLHFGDFGHWNIGPGTAYPIDQTLDAPLEGVEEVTVTDVANAVVLRTGGDRLTARLEGECVSSSGPLELRVTPRGSALDVEVRYPPAGVRRTDCTLTVTFPAGYAGDLRVSTVSGGITAGELTNRLDLVRIGTTSGDCALPAIDAARLEFASVSGDLTADGALSGGLTARTTSGGIRAAGVSGPVDFSSVSGDADVACVSPGDVRCETTSGDIALRLPSGAEFNLEFNTVSGGIQNDFPIVLTSSGRRSVSGTVGEGGFSVRISTVSGDAAILEQ